MPDSLLKDSAKRKFLYGLELINQFQYQNAEEIFRKFLAEEQDSAILYNSKKILVDLLFFKSDWSSIKELDTLPDRLSDKDNIQSLVEAFNNLPDEQIIYLSDSSLMKITFSPSGCPIAEVIINGCSRYFWVDTGSNYTVISTEIAHECNMLPIVNESSRALTGTSFKVPVKPTYAKEFVLGNLKILNHPVIIADTYDLKLRLTGTSRLTILHGIIGWKALQNLDVTINYPDASMILRKPVKLTNENKNFFWLGVPFIKVFTPDSIVLNMGFDSGSSRSSITENIFNKIGYDRIFVVTKTLGSIGSTVYNESKRVPELTIAMGGKNITFSNIGTDYQQKNLFVSLDGILGSDFLRQGIVRFDLMNGVFEFNAKQ